MSADVLAVSSEPRETFWRSLHALNATRVIIAGVLLVYWGLESISDVSHPGHRLCQYTSIFYLVIALAFVAVPFWYQRHFFSQLLAQILLDILVISLLYVNSGGMKSGFAILYLFPLASAAILIALVLSLFFASLVTFVLLLDSFFRMLYQESDARLAQAGMYGAAFLSAVYVVNRLAARLISQEALASRRGADLRIQMTINQMAIAHMEDGFMVVNAGGVILASNPAAERLLGLSLAHDMLNHGMSDIPGLQPLAEAYAAWRLQDSIDGPEHDGAPSLYLVIKHGENSLIADFEPVMQTSAAHLQVRFVSVPTEQQQEEHAIIYLQDVASIEHHAQQLKLASMGRLTASIAHEVRNPLAAISHASSLLAEDLREPGQERLLRIVKDNVMRMNRMVGDILNLSRRAQTHEVVELPAALAEVTESFCELYGLSKDMLQLNVEQGITVRFDSMHLREVVLNLLTNAIRYASGRPGSIRIGVVRPAQRRVELHMQDDGPSISANVRAHLFEPFYTTSSKGTGLGLYLARELCMNNGARLDYEFHRDGPHGHASGRFVVTFAPIADLESAELLREERA